MESQAEAKILPFAKKRGEESQTSAEGLPGTDYTGLPATGTSPTRRYVVDIAVDDISLSPFQTREIAGNEELAELKASVETHGVIQPIIVRELPLDDSRETSYELIAGERRLRAATLAGLERIPALVQPLNDQQSLEVSIIENAQRENLNPIEEAKAYQLLASRFQMNQGEIAKTVGKNRTSVSNSLRLLQLQPAVIDMLKAGELSAGHGRALLMIEHPRRQLRLAWRAIHSHLSVRTLEELARRLLEHEKKSKRRSKDDKRQDQHLRRVESKVCQSLGIEKVRLQANSEGQRQLTLHFPTESSWRKFLALLR